MKTKVLILALTVIFTSLGTIAQQTVPEPVSTECNKKVLKKIKREIAASDALDHMVEGTLVKYRLVCFINDQNKVELKNIEGNNEALKVSIRETFLREEIDCTGEVPGSYFTFILTLKKLPA